jgi:hypothetical protein
VESQSTLYTFAGLVISALCTVVGILWGRLKAMQDEQKAMGQRLDEQAERIGYSSAVGHAVANCSGGQPCPYAKTFKIPEVK